jgi:hypothetical protein
MECVIGRILKGKDVLVDGVEVWLAKGTQKWNGTFELPPGKHVDVGDTYRLELRDGRVGSVKIINVGAPDDVTHTVGFQGELG